MKYSTSVGRPKTFTKEAVLKLAMYHFWEHGYDSTSLDDLLPSMGIKKSSFYRTFTSKEEVFSLSLDLYRKETFSWLESLEKELGVKEALVVFIKTSIDELRESGTIKGCLLLNSSKECYGKYPQLSQQITIEFEALVEFLTKMIQKAQDEGKLQSRLEAKKLTIQLLAIYSGIMMLVQAGAKADEVDDLLFLVEQILQ